MKKYIQFSIAGLLCLTAVAAAACCWIIREPVLIRELELGGAVQPLQLGENSAEVHFEAYAICTGTEREFEETKARLRKQPRLLQSVSEAVASTRPHNIWTENDLAAWRAEFHREIQQNLGDNTVIGVGIKNFSFEQNR